MSMRMGMNQGLSGRGEMQQQMKMSPPVSSSLEEVHSKMPEKTLQADIDDKLIEAVRSLINNEKPTELLSDQKIVTLLQEEFEISAKQVDVAMARRAQDIPPTIKRRTFAQQ